MPYHCLADRQGVFPAALRALRLGDIAMNPFYEIKEASPDGFRAVVVTLDQNGGTVDFLSSDEATHRFALSDFSFLTRAARSLPREVLEPAVQVAAPVVQAQPEPQAVPGETKPEPEQSERAGKRWSDEEEALLVERFKAGNGILSLSKSHQRAPNAIISRLYLLDLIEVTAKR